MPRAILEGFNRLRENLQITDLQETTVSTRQQNVRAAVEEELEVLDSFLTGSHRRNTMIAPLSEADVDIFVVLSSKYWQQDGQAALLDRVKSVLRQTYPKTPDISRNGQAVTIVFNDFRVDVVPGFYRQGGGFLIPDSVLGRWISTDPKRHVETFADANKSHQGNLIPLIKMMKAWNKKHSTLLRSFHLEVLVLNILTNVTISDFPSGARYVFDKARGRVRETTADPAGYGGNVGAYLNTREKLEAVIDRLETAYTRARDAEQLKANGRTAQAYEKWQMIFGDYFPAYG